jgi:hypothetical protein
VNGSGNHTEYNWNIGDIEGDGYEMEWCASFCSWPLLQSGVTTHNSFNDACRNHPNDPNYIWREVGCPLWVTLLENAGLYSLRGTYTPRSGDLVFFNCSNTVGHIALVVWCNGSTDKEDKKGCFGQIGQANDVSTIVMLLALCRLTFTLLIKNRKRSANK